MDEVDKDRVASLNISLRAAQKVGSTKHYFLSQIPEAGAPVSGHVLKDEGCRWYQTTQSFKPTDLSVGS